jgi:mannose-6-phosphate isomerase
MDLLTNPVQAYPWGSTTALPKLLGRPVTGEPQAELWVGAHERAPSRLTRNGVERALDEVIAADPAGELGEMLAANDRLPFLLKILAVERPLSLQVHPDTASARKAYQAEEAAGVAPDAAERSFPDPSAKPEMLYAITDFSAFSGLADVEQAREVLAGIGVPALQPVRDALHADSDPMRAALTAALQLPASDVLAVTEHISAAAAGDMSSAPASLSPDLARIASDFPDDPAVVALLLMRTVTLAPGETCYVGAGQLHCYLAGVACEVQANSDNVLRAGLTSKHVDVETVLALVDTSDDDAAVPSTTVGVERVYQPPTDDFALAEIGDVTQPMALADVAGPALLMCLRGHYEVSSSQGGQAELSQGAAAYVAARCGSLRVRGSGVLLRVTTGRAG